MTENITYNRIPTDRYDELHGFIQQSFWPERGTDPSDWPNLDIEDRFGEPYGLFEDGEIRCSLHRQPFQMRIRGDWHDLRGLSTIVSPPEYRRSGYASRLLVAEHQATREDGVAFVAAWPFKHSFYANYGWIMTNTFAHMEGTPAEFRPKNPVDAGSFRQLSPDEWSVVDALYREHAQNSSLSVKRTEHRWRTHMFSPGQTTHYVFVWESDGVERGYVIYHVSDTGTKTIHVRELIASDGEAYRALLTFLSYHDSQISTVKLPTIDPTGFLNTVVEPSAIDASVHPGPIARVVDVPRALREISYPADVSGTVRLGVSGLDGQDSERTYELTISDGSATCGTSTDDPELTIGVDGLTQLVLGSREIDSLVWTGDAVVQSDDVHELLAEAFPAEPVYMHEQF